MLNRANANVLQAYLRTVVLIVHRSKPKGYVSSNDKEKHKLLREDIRYPKIQERVQRSRTN